MSRPHLIRLAAILCFLTGIAHTIGTFMDIPPDQAEMLATVETMKGTMVPMPVGSDRSYMQILDGNNLCTSLFLFLCGVLLFSAAKAPTEDPTARTILIVALALAIFAIISANYFFPIPAILTSVAASLCLYARTQRQAAQSAPGLVDPKSKRHL